MFRLYVLYRLPQLQIIDSEAVSDKERKEAAIRGQFAVKLNPISKQQQQRLQERKYDGNDNDVKQDVNSKHENTASSWEDEDGDVRNSNRGFQTRMMKKNTQNSNKPATTKPSEGNRYISNQQL